MRTNARSLPALAAALLLGASAAAVSGCCTTAPRNRAVAVNVIVTYDPAANTAVMAPSDKTIFLSETYQDFAQWASPDGIVHVTFIKESPFDSLPKHEKKVLKSGPPKKGTAGRGFDYTAELWLDPDGTHRVRIDPRIEIVP
jgi:hypothetical protein